MDFKKYLLLSLVLVFASSSIVNHKVIRVVNYEGIYTTVNTQIDVLNDSPEGSKEITSYMLALNSTIHDNLIHLDIKQDKKDNDKDSLKFFK